MHQLEICLTNRTPCCTSGKAGYRGTIYQALNQHCGAGAATFRVEPEPIFYLAGAESRSRLF